MVKNAIAVLWESFENDLKMKYLSSIRVPYATAHTIRNSILTVNNAHFQNDYKEDDEFITRDYQAEHEEEPPAAWADYHIPKNN